MFCIVIFSFSTNYVASVIIRLIHGLLDGVLPIVTAIVSEISNERNIALGTSSIFVGIAIGGYLLLEQRITCRLLGPILCGYLSNPERIPFLVEHFPIFEKVELCWYVL